MLVFEAPQTLERVARMGDLFGPLESLQQKLPKFPAAEANGKPSGRAVNPKKTVVKPKKQAAVQTARKRKV